MRWPSCLVRSLAEEAVRVRALAWDIVLCSWARHFTKLLPAGFAVTTLLRVGIVLVRIDSRQYYSFWDSITAKELARVQEIDEFFVRHAWQEFSVNPRCMRSIQYIGVQFPRAGGTPYDAKMVYKMGTFSATMVYERGTFSAIMVYKRGTFSAKKVYKRVLVPFLLKWDIKGVPFLPKWYIKGVPFLPKWYNVEPRLATTPLIRPPRC